MVISLDKLIVENLETLVDGITKDAIRQIPSYREAPLRRTIERVETWLEALATSIEKNEPEIMEHHLVMVAHERQEEGYALSELHNIIQISEYHLDTLIQNITADQVEQNALEALLKAVMGAARMVVSVNYVLLTGNKSVD